MTRETRIGLLVGLGFIIMFGLVLTELTGSGRPEPPPTSLADGEQLALAPAPAEEISPVVVDRAGEPPRLGPPLYPSPSMTLTASDDSADDQPAGSRRVVAVVPVGHDGQADEAPVAVTPAAQIASAFDAATGQRAIPPRTYVVKPNDSLIRIAAKVYGPAHRREYMRIYEANRDKLADPSIVVVGQELVIPPLAAAVTGPLPNSLARPVAGAAPTGHTYVTKRGDNLTKIARNMLNDGSHAAVMRIVAANKDRLSDPDRLPVGVELVIPR